MPPSTPATADPRQGGHGPAWGKIAAWVTVFVVLAAIWRWTPLSQLVSAERVAEWARSLRELPWAPVAVIAIYTPAAFVMFPRPLLTVITVIAFGPWLGYLYGMTGIMISALATFYVGRALPDSTVRRLAGEKLDRMQSRLRKHGFVSVLAVRVVPAAPFAIEGMVAGALKIKVWDYSLGTFLGMAPGVLATTVFGMEITNVLSEGGSFNYWLVGAVVVAFAIMTYAVARWFARQTAG